MSDQGSGRRVSRLDVIYAVFVGFGLTLWNGKRALSIGVLGAGVTTLVLFTAMNLQLHTAIRLGIGALVLVAGLGVTTGLVIYEVGRDGVSDLYDD